MANFKVVWDIEVNAETPLEAAKQAQQWMQRTDSNWQFYIQEEGKKEIFDVDLEEEDENAVLPVKNYIPMIK